MLTGGFLNGDILRRAELSVWTIMIVMLYKLFFRDTLDGRNQYIYN
jgi:hypothetical protein